MTGLRVCAVCRFKIAKKKEPARRQAPLFRKPMDQFRMMLVSFAAAAADDCLRLPFRHGWRIRSVRHDRAAI